MKNTSYGRGAVHSHLLDWVVNAATIGLPEKMSAHIPDDEDNHGSAMTAEDRLMKGLVLDSQLDYKDSAWPVNNSPSSWDHENAKVRLRHTKKDHKKHVRAYFKKPMKVTKCHEDVQQVRVCFICYTNHACKNAETEKVCD